MSDWQDYALGGGGGAASGAATGAMIGGPWGALAGGVIGGGLGLLGTYKTKQGGNQIKAAYDQARGQSQVDQEQLRQLMDSRRAEALGYYKPLQSLFNQAYGTSGIAAPQVPQASGRPLDAMYKGSR